MPKVCLLAPVPPPAGGIAGWTKRMMSAELKDGWEVVVVDEQVLGGRTNFGASSKAKFFPECKRSFRIWKDLWKALGDKDVKVVQSCVPAGKGSLLRETVCRKIVHLKKRKFIIHFRCTVPNMVSSGMHTRLFKRFVNRCDFALLLNKQSEQFVKKLCPDTVCKVVPNFIDAKELVEKTQVNPAIRTALYVGGVIKEKGCQLIVETAKLLPDIVFRLVGKPGLKEQVFPENVILCGEQPKEVVAEEMKNADLFLFLSAFWGEGFSNALAEAMAASLPCIVTDWAANADMIGDGGGKVVDPDPAAVKEAILSLEDPTVREEMGRRNFRKVRDCYLESRITGEYVDIYNDLIK